MKKSLLILLVLVIALCGVCFTACDWFESSTTNSSARKTDITVYTDNESEEYSIKIGEIATINTTTKNGYYLKGFYTQRNGGEMYFDCYGDAVAKWEEGFPTTFYAQWESVIGYKSEIQEWDGPYMFYGDPNLRLGWEISGKQMKTILNGNWKQRIKISIYGRVIAPVDTVYLHFQDRQYGGAEVYATKIIEIQKGRYVEFFYEIECSAKIFYYDYTMYFRFNEDYHGFTASYVKDLAAHFTFV